MNIRSGMKAAGLLFVLLAGTSFLQAQNTRSWVSGVGDDANPCSRTAPCKTFAGAFAKTNAGGEIDALDGGGYGTLTITKAITIDGSGGNVAGILPNGVPAFTINAGVNDVVVLRNISINGALVGIGVPGIKFNSGAALHIENCVISSNTGNGIEFTPAAQGSELFVSNTTLLENGTASSTGNALVRSVGGTVVNAIFSNVRFERGGVGLRVEDGGYVTVRNSYSAGNRHNGFLVVSTTLQAILTLVNSTSSFNLTNGISSVNPSAVVRIADDTVVDNAGAALISTNSGQILSFTQGGAGTNNIVGPGAPTGFIPRL